MRITTILYSGDNVVLSKDLAFIHLCRIYVIGNPCNIKIQSRINELLKGVAYVRRLKLVLIGPGGVGKSCLKMRLENKDFDEALKSTDGVSVGNVVINTKPSLNGSARVRSEVCDGCLLV